MNRENTTLEISEDKIIKITYGALVAVFIGVAGFATWMTSIQLNMSAYAANIDELQKEKEDTRKIIVRIDKSVTEIKTFLRIKHKRQENDDE